MDGRTDRQTDRRSDYEMRRDTRRSDSCLLSQTAPSDRLGAFSVVPVLPMVGNGKPTFQFITGSANYLLPIFQIVFNLG